MTFSVGSVCSINEKAAVFLANFNEVHAAFHGGHSYCIFLYTVLISDSWKCVSFALAQFFYENIYFQNNTDLNVLFILMNITHVLKRLNTNVYTCYITT